jgi:hypothetical protein
MAGLVATSLPASGQTPELLDGPAWEEYGFQGEGEAREQNVDARLGIVKPTSRPAPGSAALGASAARFNRFGSPQVLLNHTGVLAGPREGCRR